MRFLLALVTLAVLAYVASAGRVHPRLRELANSNEYDADEAIVSAIEMQMGTESQAELEARAQAQAEAMVDNALGLNAEAEAEAENEADAEVENEVNAFANEEAGSAVDAEEEASAEAEAEADSNASAEADAEAESEESSELDVENEDGRALLESEAAPPKGAPASYQPGDEIAVMPPKWPPVFNPPLLSAPKGSVPRDDIKWANSNPAEYPPSEFQYDNFEVDKAALDIIDDPVTVKYREDREEFDRFEKLITNSNHLVKRAARLAEGTNAVKTPIIYYIRQDKTLTVP